MSLARCRKELKECLAEKSLKDFSAVVMPDFFLDRLINLQWNVKDFSSLVADVAKRKGGSIDGIHQDDIKGGNAINVASALILIRFQGYAYNLHK